MLSVPSRLSELLLRWDESRRRGQPLGAEDLCRDCPELLEGLRLQIAALGALDPVLDTETVTRTAPPSGPTPAPAGAGGPPADYEILGELGRGGMGVVYRAFDRRRGVAVALKALPRIGPSALERFKREFRVLADVAHPNLVTLHELVSDGHGWFLTMELVEGVDFLAHVRAGDEATRPGRLRDALRQLAAGVAALHRAGKLHRDLKPSNVRVDRSGRVVILDFGLAAELGPDGQHQSTEAHVLGTAAYMAPEQAAGLPVSPAADWYSVGVMIYEALTGRRPFGGGAAEVLAAKQVHEPPPRERVPGVPRDLDALCSELLRRDPRERPAGADILRRLGVAPDGPGTVLPSQSPPQQAIPLVGRRRHLEALEAAFAAVQRGRTVAVFMHGASGAGKTALARRFLDGLIGRDAAVVLTGRCYEQEAVPYKALDGLVDALSHYLRRLSDADARALLPRDVLSLARVFPVLRCVEAVAASPGRSLEVPEPQELRRRAFAALRELLARLGDREPLVLFIDDLQWGDLDSAALLTELIRPPDAPCLLLLGCYRSEDAGTSPFLRALRRPESMYPEGDRRELAVEALKPAEAADLAAMLLDTDDPTSHPLAATIARESDGSPFFVAELVRHVQAGLDLPGHISPGEDVTLDRVLWARIERLPDDARRLLEVVAISGRPIGQTEASRAAEVGADGREAAAVLRSGRLVRGTGSAERDEVETYHDRIRETIVAHLGPAVQEQHHRRLAHVLKAWGQADPEVLAFHFHGAGEAEAASEYYAMAADRAARALAFDRAVTLYRRALDLGPSSDASRRSLRTELAEALANAGRGAEAAEEYLAATDGVFAAEAIDLRRRAAGQLLISGHVDAGLVVLRDVLGAVGIRFPGTPRRALASLLLQQIRLGLRGLDFRPRDASQVPAEDLARIDICWSAAIGLSNIDVIRGAHFQSRGLLLALRAGDAFRIARALVVEAAHASTSHGSSCRRPAKLFRVADRMVRQLDHPYTTGLLWLIRGIVAYLECRHREVQESLSRASETFRHHCPGAIWESDTSHIYTIWSLADMGEIAELVRRRSALLRAARDRGDLYAEANLNTYSMPIARLAADEVNEADEELSRILSRWSQRGYYLQHKNAMVARTMIELYREVGSGTTAWGVIQGQWGGYNTSLLNRIKFNRIDIHQLRGRSAIAAARRSADPRDLLRIAEIDARCLDRERTPCSAAMARMIRAGAAATRGDAELARVHLLEAAGRFEALDMRLWAWAARRRLGELLGGDEGGDLVARADAWMTDQAIRNPARMTAMLIPGFLDR
jgi:hypothetical protein